MSSSFRHEVEYQRQAKKIVENVLIGAMMRLQKEKEEMNLKVVEMAKSGKGEECEDENAESLNLKEQTYEGTAEGRVPKQADEAAGGENNQKKDTEHSTILQYLREKCEPSSHGDEPDIKPSVARKMSNGLPDEVGIHPVTKSSGTTDVMVEPKDDKVKVGEKKTKKTFRMRLASFFRRRKSKN